MDFWLLLLCRPDELEEPFPKMEDWVGGGPEWVGIGGGEDSSFCTSMGMSLSSVPVSSSYRHRFFGAESCVVLATVPVSAAFPLPLFDALPGAGNSGTPPPVETVGARDHSWLVLASKKPEHLVRICRCNRYRFSSPLGTRTTISTSPLWLKMGNSFWGMNDAPPAWDRLYRRVRDDT